MEKKIATILAGGASQRFGSNKAFAKLNGKRLIEILIDRLQNLYFEVVLSGPRGELSVFGLPVLEDDHPLNGPLDALAGILRRTDSKKIFLAACDMPFVHEAVIEEMWKVGGFHDAVVSKEKNKICPLPGVYSTNLLPIVEMLLKKGRRDLKSIVEISPNIRVLSDTELCLVDPEIISLKNINTPEDLDIKR